MSSTGNAVYLFGILGSNPSLSAINFSHRMPLPPLYTPASGGFFIAGSRRLAPYAHMQGGSASLFHHRLEKRQRIGIGDAGIKLIRTAELHAILRKFIEKF